MEKRRIPATLAAFNFHLINVDAYLHNIAPGTTLMRGELLGMTAAELLTLSHFHTAWTSDDPLHPGVWDLHSRKDKKTSVTRQNVLQVMSDFSAFFRPILMRITYSPNITNDDRVALRIAEPVIKRSRPTLPIGESCWAAPTVLGGSRMKFRCSTTTDSGKASKPPRADAVEIAYLLVLPHQKSPDGKEIPTYVMAWPDESNTKFISTKAAFIMEFGLDYMGYQLQFFTRWINTRHPKLNGPWTGPLVGYIG
jgi:hypothetical protein